MPSYAFLIFFRDFINNLMLSAVKSDDTFISLLKECLGNQGEIEAYAKAKNVSK
jgi:hypothetical protein